jgi:hypothetical protein
MPPPKLPLEILIMIARILTDEEGHLCLADFNWFLKVNRALYACLNRTLWQEAVELQSMTHCVFTHLIRTNDLPSLRFFLELGAAIETRLPEFEGNVDGDEWDDWGLANTPLKVAVIQDNVLMVRVFLEHDDDLVRHDKFDPSGYGAIHAARSADPEQQVHTNIDRYTTMPCGIISRPCGRFCGRAWIPTGLIRLRLHGFIRRFIGLRRAVSAP